MLKIIKKGRWGFIEGEIDKRLEKVLNNALSYKKDGFQFMPNKQWGYVRFYNHRLKRFPWGLVKEVRKILTAWTSFSTELFEVEKQSAIIEKDKEPKGLRPYQREAIKALIENYGGTISMPCGSGKTRTMLGFLDKIKYKKALVIVPTLFLKIQWEQEVGKRPIDIRNYQSKIKKSELENYDVLIMDENHCVAASTVYKIAINFGEGILVGCSATPYRNYQPETMKIVAALGEVVYDIKAKDLIKEGYLVEAEVEIFDDITLEKDDMWKEYREIYEDQIIENPIRNSKIIELARIRSEKGLVFITVELLKHGEILFNELKTDNAVFVHGNLKNRNKIYNDIKNGRYNIVITTKVFDLGVDFTNLRTLIIGNGGKSSVRIVQQIGRVLRPHKGKTKATIIDFHDRVKYLNLHYKNRYKIYNENFRVIEHGREGKSLGESNSTLV